MNGFYWTILGVLALAVVVLVAQMVASWKADEAKAKREHEMELARMESANFEKALKTPRSLVQMAVKQPDLLGRSIGRKFKVKQAGTVGSSEVIQNVSSAMDRAFEQGAEEARRSTAAAGDHGEGDRA